jgi:hypothetical protein
MMNNISNFQLHYCLSRPGPGDQYTKIVWADTYKVGCGFTGFHYPFLNYYFGTYLCLYGPGGNVVGGNVYKIGAPCTACPAGTTCDDGLCA